MRSRPWLVSLSNKSERSPHLRKKMLRICLLSCCFGLMWLSASVPVHAATVPAYKLERLPLLNFMLQVLRRRYIDPTQFKPKAMFKAGLQRLEAKIDGLWVRWSKDGRSLLLRFEGQEQRFEVGEFFGIFDVLLKMRPIAAFLKKHYRGKLTLREIDYTLVAGVTSTLDKQTGLIVRSLLKRSSAPRPSGRVGVVFGRQGQSWVIAELVLGGPARLAGLRVGDRLIQIDGKPVTTTTRRSLVASLRGRRGTRVALQFQRNGWPSPKRFVLIRAHIPQPLVRSYVLPGRIGYVSLAQFSRGAAMEIRAHLARLRQRNKGPLLGLLLDLRSNPGGLVSEAVEICSMFVDRGVVTTFVGGNIKRRSYNIQQDRKEEGYPLLVLLNGGSASASELLSGALRNHNRAVILGRQSYGKGTAQQISAVNRDVILRLTMAQYLLPGDQSIQGIGVTPDIQVLPVKVGRAGIVYDRTTLSDMAIRRKRWPKFLQQNLSQKKDALFRLRYLHQETLGTSEGTSRRRKKRGTKMAKAWRRPTKHPLANDDEVWLARYLVARAKSARRDLFLQQIKPAIAWLRQREAGRIQRTLQRRQIDWRLARRPAKKAVPVWVEVEVEPKSATAATPMLRISLQNRGKRAVHQVRGIFLSSVKSWQHKELLFGRLKPRQRLTKRLPFPPVQGRRARIEPLKLRLQAADATFVGKDNKTRSLVTLPLQVLASPHPQLALSFQVLDQPPDGNGDGLLQPGELVRLRLSVTNQSKTATMPLRVGWEIREKPLQQPWRWLGRLRARERRTLIVQLRVPAQAKAKRWNTHVVLTDKRRSFRIRHALDLRVAKPLFAITKKVEGVVTLTKAARLWTSPSRQSWPVALVSAGSSWQCLRRVGAFWMVKLPANLRLWGQGPGPQAGPSKPKTDAGLAMREDGFAWVHNDVVRYAAKAKASASQIRLYHQIAPPVFSLARPSATTWQNPGAWTLQGSIRSAHGIRDVHVQLGKRKVWYRFVSAKPQGNVTLQLKQKCSLRPGVNIITVTVRTAQGRFQRQLAMSVKP